MAIRYKIDVLDELKQKGYTTYKLRKDKLLGEATIQRLRKGDFISWDNVSTICSLLQCELGDVLEYVPDEPTE